MISHISFSLENTSADTDVVATLVPAMLRRNGTLAGKFLKGSKFKDETGTIDINVTDVVPAGAVDEFNEFSAQLTNIKVLGVTLGTESLAQATQYFLDKTHIEFKPAVVANIDAKLSLVPGKSEVQNLFVQPWLSGPMRTLQLKLLKGEKVSVTMILDMPDFSNNAEVQAAILPQQ